MTAYEPIYPTPGWPDKMTFSPAVRAGEFLYISGMTAIDDNHEIVGFGDIAEQTRQIFRQMGPILEAVGAGYGNIVETTDYFLTLDGYRETADVRREFFQGPPYPAATGVLVAGLIRKDALIEIKAVARLDG